MKRAFSLLDGVSSNEEPQTKVVLVERDLTCGPISSVSRSSRPKLAHIDDLALSEDPFRVDSAMYARIREVIYSVGRDYPSGWISEVNKDPNRNARLHRAACNFVKKPGQVYHLYRKLSGQEYFGMLSPEDWNRPPHQYLGSYKLEENLSWTPALPEKYQGMIFLN